MNPNTLKSGAWWLLKAAILVSLSLVVIFLSSPKAEAATITGDLITSWGVPAVKLDADSIVMFQSPESANRFWGYVGDRVQLNCDVRNSTIFNLSSMVSVSRDNEKIWEGGSDQPTGGEIVVTPLQRIEGSLMVRHSRLAVDISPAVLYGGYTDVTLDGLSLGLTADLFKLANTYGAQIVAEGELDGLVMAVDNLWVDGVQRKQLGFAQ